MDIDTVVIQGRIFKVFETEACYEPVQRRRHKKERVDKKWAKRYGYCFVPKCYVIKGEYIACPPGWKEIIRKAAEDGKVTLEVKRDEL